VHFRVKTLHFFGLYFSSGNVILMQPFKIGERQHTAFREDAERRYVASVADFLKENVPEAAKDKPEALRAFVAAMVKRAKEYGMATKRDAAVYVTTSYLLGENFEDDFEVARQVLDSSLPSPDKAEWLQQATVLLLLNAGERKQD
jgi:hypothetical protein